MSAHPSPLVHAELTPGGIGLITLDRPKALNALSLEMVRAITAALRAWQQDGAVRAVALRGMGKAASEGGAPQPFGAFCAGGDIRFFHQAALAGDASLAEFFTEEYALNHLSQSYGKPVISFLDGIVMGGGMGLCQGPSALANPSRQGVLRIVTERTKMAMPETKIGLFPDVGGGHFLARTPGHLGEYLALTGRVLKGAEAVAAELADGTAPAERMPEIWRHLAAETWESGAAAVDWIASQFIAAGAEGAGAAGLFDLQAGGAVERCFGQPTLAAIMQALEAEGTDWARQTLAALKEHSPLMMAVTLEQIRRARGMSLADELRMERDMVHQCFALRPGAASETVEGIRALAVDKDHSPRWNPARVQDVTPEMVDAFFKSPWSAGVHPLAALR